MKKYETSLLGTVIMVWLSASAGFAFYVGVVVHTIHNISAWGTVLAALVGVIVGYFVRKLWRLI